MIGEVLLGPEEGGADFAIADLSMTSARAEVVDFSMPWMTLGKVTIAYSDFNKLHYFNKKYTKYCTKQHAEEQL